MAHIYIYSGPVHSGKTSRLNNWIKTISSVDGIMAPVFESKRYLKFIASGRKYLLETDLHDNEDVIRIGKYRFLKKILDEAKNYLGELAHNPPEWIVIDEIGLLELEGRGLEPAVSKLIKEMENTDVNILFVVRDYLKQKVIEYYQLDSSEVNDFVPV